MPPRSLRSLPPDGARQGSGRPVALPTAEHEFEAARGLPEPLPPGERILWQGAPDFATLARRTFHVGTLAGYFAAILAIRAATVLGGGGSAADAAIAVAWLAPAALAALALVATLAWLSSRTTLYTVTDRRVVMRIGIVLSVAFNLPYSRIAAAAVSAPPGDAGDIALTLEKPDHIAWLHLWPHARPWNLARPQPSLRCVPDAHAVGRTIGDAWRAARDGAAAPQQPVATPSFAQAARRRDPAHGAVAHA